MSFTDLPFYGFDLETTGVSVHDDRIVTATISQCIAGAEPRAKSWLVNPGIDIPEGATKVHGISTDHARDNGMDAKIAVDQIAQYVAWSLTARQPLVIFNAAYDLSLLTAECVRHGLPTVADRVGHLDWHTVIDPMVIIRALDTMNRNFKKGRKYTLAASCERFKVRLDEADAHTSAGDVAASVQLARVLLREHEATLGSYSPSELFTLQRESRKHDQRRFAEWVAREGKQEQYGDIDESWPMHSRLLEAVPA